MDGTSNWLVHDHRKYDAALAECEEVAEEGLWKEAVELFNAFIDEFKLHMQMEDEVLYPIFEERFGDPKGEITYLSAEHDNLVRLLRDLSQVIKRKDSEHFLASLVPLHKAMNEHNKNEEAVFLGMADDSLLLRRDEILARLEAVQEKAGKRVWDF